MNPQYRIRTHITAKPFRGSPSVQRRLRKTLLPLIHQLSLFIWIMIADYLKMALCNVRVRTVSNHSECQGRLILHKAVSFVRQLRKTNTFYKIIA